MAELEVSPIPDWELWACAHEMIRRHGADAPCFANGRAETLDREGDNMGAATWQLILHRIDQLQPKPNGLTN